MSDRRELQKILKRLDWFYHRNDSSIYRRHHLYDQIEATKLIKSTECPYSTKKLVAYSHNYIFENMSNPNAFKAEEVLTQVEYEELEQWFSELDE